ncbi:hypothetical protein [Glycomyces tenuis]|uniref:hypothetical protein n=1 Tax=Glycomyces tenuis TaxID=58116 RepID=UPI0012DC073F|nr:hypothetical protein [Glycomyces tenuis]
MAYPPAPAPQPMQPAPKQGNGFGVTALVLGLIGLIVFSWIPGVNIFTAIPLAVLAVIFGIVALAKAGSRGGKGKGTGGWGLVLGLLAIAAAIAVNVWIIDFFEDNRDELYDDYMEDCQSQGLSEDECDQIYEDTEDEILGE